MLFDHIARSRGLSEAVIAANRLRHRRARRANAAVLFTGRCGSKVLNRMMRQRADACWDSEIFRDWPCKYGHIAWLARDPLALLRYRMHRRNAAAYGFETIFTAHLGARGIDLDLDAYLAVLRGLGFGHFVVLERRNVLRQFASGRVARASGTWHSQAAADSPRRARVRVASPRPGIVDLKGRIDERQAQYRDLIARLGEDRHLHLVYEDDIEADPRVAYEKLCRFLGLEPRPVEVPLRRTTPFPLAEVIENWEEVRAHLTGTPHEWMLEG
jgi:hypothetical protein